VRREIRTGKSLKSVTTLVPKPSHNLVGFGITSAGISVPMLSLNDMELKSWNRAIHSLRMCWLACPHVPIRQLTDGTHASVPMGNRDVNAPFAFELMGKLIVGLPSHCFFL